MLRVVDDNIESPYQIVPDILDLWGVKFERFYITLLTPHGGCHGACVTSYELHLSAILLRTHMTSYSSSRQGLRNLLIG